jgi:hypothetical protein
MANIKKRKRKGRPLLKRFRKRERQRCRAGIDFDLGHRPWTHSIAIDSPLPNTH